MARLRSESFNSCNRINAASTAFNHSWYAFHPRFGLPQPLGNENLRVSDQESALDRVKSDSQEFLPFSPPHLYPLCINTSASLLVSIQIHLSFFLLCGLGNVHRTAKKGPTILSKFECGISRYKQYR